MVKVLLTRQVRAENLKRVLGLLTDLRAAALHQPGYVTGETLMTGNDPVEVLAIGTWLSSEYWAAWSTAEDRNEIECMLEPLIEGEAKAAVYRLVDEDI